MALLRCQKQKVLNKVKVKVKVSVIKFTRAQSGIIILDLTLCCELARKMGEQRGAAACWGGGGGGGGVLAATIGVRTLFLLLCVEVPFSTRVLTFWCEVCDR